MTPEYNERQRDWLDRQSLLAKRCMCGHRYDQHDVGFTYRHRHCVIDCPCHGFCARDGK